MTKEEKLAKTYAEEALCRNQEEEVRKKAEHEFLETHKKLMDETRRDEEERVTYKERYKAS